MSLPTVTSVEGVCVAYGQSAFAQPSTWTRLDTSAPSLMISEIRIQRGRQYLSDQNNAGTCEVDFTDSAGLLDPTNATGPLYPMDPNCPFAVALYDPVAETWGTIFTGMVQDTPTDMDVSERYSTGTIHAADAFALLAVNTLPAGYDYDTSGTGTVNQIGDTSLAAQTVQERILGLATIGGVPAALTQLATGNVNVQPVVEPPGSAILSLMQDAADAELPAASNLYMTRLGIVRFRGREQRFKAEDPYYVMGRWHVGDQNYVNASPTTRGAVAGISFGRDIAKVINDGLLLPQGIQDADIPTLEVLDSTSRTKFGLRAYQGDQIINAGHVGGSNTALDEVKLMNQYYVDNFKNPQTRISKLTIKSPRPGAPDAAYRWQLLRSIDISDLVYVNTTHPGGGGFVDASGEGYFVEGITYTLRPLRDDTWMVELELDLSPQAYYATNPFAFEDIASNSN